MQDFSEERLAALVQGVYDGDITERDLPENLYFAIADYLKKALYKGYGGSLRKFDIGTKDYELLKELKENIYMFSAAKTYQQVREMTDALTDDDGKVRSMKEFKESARDIFDQYNDNWLEAEYHTTLGQGMMAIKWNKIQEQKDVLALLKYDAVDDEVTCDICGPLNGLIAPVDDPVWDEYYPENHFRCRCTVDQVAEGDGKAWTQSQIDKVTEGVGENMAPEFKMNAGKDKVVFKEDHPYFKVEPKDRKFAERNFDLPIPDDDN